MILCPESLSTPICLRFVSDGVFFFPVFSTSAQFEILKVHHIGGAKATRLKPYITFPKPKGGNCAYGAQTQVLHQQSRVCVAYVVVK